MLRKCEVEYDEEAKFGAQNYQSRRLISTNILYYNYFRTESIVIMLVSDYCDF